MQFEVLNQLSEIASRCFRLWVIQLVGDDLNQAVSLGTLQVSSCLPATETLKSQLRKAIALVALLESHPPLRHLFQHLNKYQSNYLPRY